MQTQPWQSNYALEATGSRSNVAVKVPPWSSLDGAQLDHLWNISAKIQLPHDGHDGHLALSLKAIYDYDHNKTALRPKICMLLQDTYIYP